MITVFAARKISLVAMIDDLQFQMDLLSQKQINMTSVSMTIADGQISPDEIQQANYYTRNGIASAINFGNALSQQSMMMGQGPMVYRNPSNPNIISIHDKAKEQMQAQLAAQEKVLELQMKQLETKLHLYEKQLESVEKGEDKAVERSAPKYA